MIPLSSITHHSSLITHHQSLIINHNDAGDFEQYPEYYPRGSLNVPRLTELIIFKSMEGCPRTHESDVMQFCVIAIEKAAQKMSVNPHELAMRLERQGLIDDHLIKFYDTLHTQSANYVADDIIETLQNYEQDNEDDKR